MSTDWLIAISTIALAIGTIALALVAAFQDIIRAWVMRPKLDASITMAPPDCHKTKMKSRGALGWVEADCYYFRIRVRNSGNRRAEQVEILAKELIKQQRDGSLTKLTWFLPMSLSWSHVQRPLLDGISPEMEKHCDLGHIIKPDLRSKFALEDHTQLGVTSSKTIFSFDLEVKPFTMSHLIPPGKYRLVLLVGS